MSTVDTWSSYWHGRLPPKRFRKGKKGTPVPVPTWVGERPTKYTGSADFLADFWSRYQVMPNGCWESTATTRHTFGYGIFYLERFGGVPQHRLAWELATAQEIPEGLLACHHCDNPPCCNPEHIFIGTSKDNNADASRKGRRKWPLCRRKLHQMSGDNLYFFGDGRRTCKACYVASKEAKSATGRKTGRRYEKAICPDCGKMIAQNGFGSASHKRWHARLRTTNG